VGPVPLSGSFATARFSLNSVTVLPGFTVPVIVSFTAPKGLDAATFPVYSGYVKIVGDNGEVLQVSYLGVAASMKTMHIVDNTDA